MEINYLVENVEMPRLDEEKMKNWIEAVVRSHDKNVGNLTYIFCDDEYILSIIYYYYLLLSMINNFINYFL